MKKLFFITLFIFSLSLSAQTKGETTEKKEKKEEIKPEGGGNPLEIFDKRRRFPKEKHEE